MNVKSNAQSIKDIFDSEVYGGEQRQKAGFRCDGVGRGADRIVTNLEKDSQKLLRSDIEEYGPFHKGRGDAPLYRCR
jgi:hypothetical protein